MRKLIGALAALASLPALATAQDWSAAPMEDSAAQETIVPGDGFSTAPPAGAAPGAWDATPPAPLPAATAPAPRPAFSLYRGSEASLGIAHLRSGPGSGSFTTLALDTRHALWLAPFLGAQVDLGLASLDLDETLVTGGIHLHLLPEGPVDRFGLFWLPAWDTGFDERLDNYGIEAMFGAIPGLTVEARLGRFSGGDARGPYFGARGFYALNAGMAVVPSFEHTRLESGGLDLRSTTVGIGGEVYMPDTNMRLFGGIGLTRFAGDVPSETDLRLELGATLFAFGEPATTARARTFGRQGFIGTF